MRLPDRDPDDEPRGGPGGVRNDELLGTSRISSAALGEWLGAAMSEERVPAGEVMNILRREIAAMDRKAPTVFPPGWCSQCRSTICEGHLLPAARVSWIEELKEIDARSIDARKSRFPLLRYA